MGDRCEIVVVHPQYCLYWVHDHISPQDSLSFDIQIPSSMCIPLKQFPDGSSSIPPGSQFFSLYWTIPHVLLISPLWRQQWDFSTEIASPIGLHISLPVVKKSAISSNVNPIHQGCPMLKHWMFKPGILQRCCQKLPTSRRYLLLEIRLGKDGCDCFSIVLLQIFFANFTCKWQPQRRDSTDWDRLGVPGHKQFMVPMSKAAILSQMARTWQKRPWCAKSVSYPTEGRRSRHLMDGRNLQTT